MCGISLSMEGVCASGFKGTKREPFCDEPKGHTGPHGCYALDAAWWDPLLACGCDSKVREIGSRGVSFCPKCGLPISKEELA
jgi:hypothetical protein